MIKKRKTEDKPSPYKPKDPMDDVKDLKIDKRNNNKPVIKDPLDDVR